MKKFIRVCISLLGAVIGPGIVASVYEVLRSLEIIDLYTKLNVFVNLAIFITAGLASLSFFAILSAGIYERFLKSTRWIENKLSSIPLMELFAGCVGLILGLVVALLLSQLYNGIPLPWLKTMLLVITYSLFGYIGVLIPIKRKNEIPAFKRFERKTNKSNEHYSSKILDTSVIIDGRIFDILKTGVLEGNIVIPMFVLQELRHIADSADALKRNRGRRGLDVLNKIQTELPLTVIVSEEDFDDIDEVDLKLLKLAQTYEGCVLTNDFNLNKVAKVQGVKVLNINELANAIKPVILPGEELFVEIIKDGKEQGQGVAYLEDGTMVVVEDGSEFVGGAHWIAVTSALQTAAGRMVFGRMKPDSGEAYSN